MKKPFLTVLVVLLFSFYSALIAAGGAAVVLNTMKYSYFKKLHKNGDVEHLLGLRLGKFEYYVTLEGD